MIKKVRVEVRPKCPRKEHMDWRKKRLLPCPILQRRLEKQVSSRGIHI